MSHDVHQANTPKNVTGASNGARTATLVLPHTIQLSAPLATLRLLACRVPPVGGWQGPGMAAGKENRFRFRHSRLPADLYFPQIYASVRNPA
jgi:hypothetical protein